MIDLSSKTGEAADELYDALSSERRRCVIQVLEETSGTIDVDRLARQVAAREAEAPPGDIADDQVETVILMLHHVHLPKLADLEFIEYDTEANHVRGPLE